MNSEVITNVIRFVARSMSLLYAAFIAFFLLSDVFGDGLGLMESDWKDILEFMIFPVAVTVGLLLGLKNELLGGIISTLAMIALWLLRPDLLEATPFRILILPGLLYLWLALGERRKAARA